MTGAEFALRMRVKDMIQRDVRERWAEQQLRLRTRYSAPPGHGCLHNRLTVFEASRLTPSNGKPKPRYSKIAEQALQYWWWLREHDYVA